MLKGESGQKDFFDSYVYERLLPNKHILLDIKESLDFSFVDEAVEDLYSDTMGRPSFPPASATATSYPISHTAESEISSSIIPVAAPYRGLDAMPEGFPRRLLTRP